MVKFTWIQEVQQMFCHYDLMLTIFICLTLFFQFQKFFVPVSQSSSAFRVLSYEVLPKDLSCKLISNHRFLPQVDSFVFLSSLMSSRGIFRTQLNIYNRTYWQKYKSKKLLTFFAKKLHCRCSTGF